MRSLLYMLLAALSCAAFSTNGATDVFEQAETPVAESALDRLTFAHLARQGIRPVRCSDPVFVRRAYLDVLGTLPTAREAKEFIQNPDTRNKRRDLIQQLLDRPEYADYWAMRWGDILRIKAEFPVNLWPNAAQAYHRWVRASIAANKPYDRFARELLTSSGSNFRVGSVNFYRAIQNRTPEGIAGAVALTFMGARIEGWPAERAAGVAAFFSQIGYKATGEWKEEHVFWDPLGTSTAPGNTAPGRANVADIGGGTNLTGVVTARTNQAPAQAIFPDGTTVALPSDRDPREVFADWLVRPENPWFTRSIVNRTWAWLLGRGIIHEPDDIRDGNLPTNPALLALLEQQFIASGYDLKQLLRLILTSETYQLSPIPGAAAEPVFACYSVRRLEAEVLSDAINRVTGTSDLYTSPIPEPFTYIPKGVPAVAIADGSITSPFLALFGRSARATGMENERNNKSTPAQWLYLLNSTEVQRKLEQGPRLQSLFTSNRKPSEIVEDLYLTILSRFPAPEELELLESYGRSPTVAPAQRNRAAVRTAGQKRREDWVDVAWALINTEEFLFRH